MTMVSNAPILHHPLRVYRLANRCGQRQWQQWWRRIRQCRTVTVVAASVETMAVVALARKVTMMGADSNQQKEEE